MTKQEYLTDIKTRFGEQRSKDGMLIRDMDDEVLLKKMLERYPGDRDEIVDLEETELSEVPDYPKSEVQQEAEQRKKSFLERVREKYGEYSTEFKENKESDANPLRKKLRELGSTAGFIGDVAVEGIKSVPGGEMAIEKTGEVISEIPGVKPGMEKYQEFAQKYPEAAKDIESAFDIASLVPIGKAGQLGLKAGEEALEAGSKKVAEVSAKQAVKTADAEREIIQEMIAPGLNAKEVRRAMDEGRLTRGTQGFWFGKKPDVVEVSDKIKEISDTVKRRIPDASTLDDVGLNSRLKNEITNISVELEPKMRQVKLREIKPSETPLVTTAKRYKTPDEFVNAFNRGELDVDTVERIKAEYGDDVFDDPTALRDLFARSQNPSMIDVAFNAWERVKKKQMNNPEFIEFAGSGRFQEIFESYLNRLRKGTDEKTLNDLWNLRKEYDASIPDRIKNANDMSPNTSQIQKEMWLENRRILNDIINDSARGLGTESQQAFKDMSDLYTAKENIVSKTKLEKAKPGVIQKTGEFIKGGAQQAVPFGMGAIIF